MATKPSTAGRRYAEAVYQLATRDDALDAFAEGLDLASGIVAQEDVLEVLRNPARPLRQRTDLVDALIASRVPEPVLKLVALLVERGRIDRLAQVTAEYRRMLNAERGVVEAVAKTAMPLTQDETAALQKKVAGMTGRTVDLRVEVDESLIGGITVRVGDTLYDASVRGRLERLRHELIARGSLGQ
jgi:F-type H+-transporting ATPase subunit delta